MFKKIQKRQSYQVHRWLWLVVSILAALVFFARSGAVPDTYAQSATVTVDFATQLGTPTYRASGWIYGLSEDGSQPPQNFLSDINAQFVRAGGAQLDCPNGGWVNGQYTRRWNSVKAYYDKITAVGGTFVLLPHDLWGADAVCTVPRWPGDNNDWTEFDQFMAQIISDVQTNNMTDIVWDIWNEPDLNSFWGRSQSQYLEMWKRAYQQIRTAFPNAVISGPSSAGQPSTGSSWFNAYLDYIAQNNVVPNYISWHELNSLDPVNSRNNIDGMLSSRSISVQGFQINEYGGTSEQGPGDSAWYIARLERSGMDGMRANWGMYGGLYDTMGELIVNSGGYKPLGTWWVYKRYADMTGTRIGVTGSDTIDGVAATDSATNKAIIVLGSRNTSGTVTVNVTNIPAYLISNGQIRVLVERMPETNGKPVITPTLVQEQDLVVSNNQVNVPIAWSNSADAYVLTLTPSNGLPGRHQYEAEDATLAGGTCTATDHTEYTGSGFVACYDATANGRNTTFTVNSASPGNHDVTLRYSAGPNGPATDRSLSIYVNGVKIGQTILTRTSTWDDWAFQTETLSLNAGSNTITYQLDSGDTGWVNLDNIVISSRGTQYEAEDGAWGGGASVATDHTGYIGTGFVAFVTQTGAYNTFTVNTPSAGNYPVTLRYSAGPDGPATDRSMSVYVNGTDVVQTVLPRTATWNDWTTKTETLSLNAGSNTITYKYDASDTGWINLDHIVVGN